MKKIFLILLLAVVLAAIAILPFKASAADGGVLTKLSKVLANQNQILSQLSEIKAELNKIKIRVQN